MISQSSCRHHIALGDLVADLVRRDSRFDTVTPPRFALTCFCLKVSIGWVLLCAGQRDQHGVRVKVHSSERMLHVFNRLALSLAAEQVAPRDMHKAQDRYNEHKMRTLTGTLWE